ncbi:uncharacterized protein LOC116194617 [Punica granatum]|uniref:Uncharacterized protein LOC116194617 n=1 Tax=Punica granatum TaxID=22663 RepID=A0A6P8C6Y7_PUNGR|nr:uncharacterized protein LOC116194617 [Punica granatum]
MVKKGAIPSPFIRKYQFEELRSLTNGFGEDNYIGEFQFGRAYRAVHEDTPVVVKIWEDKGTNYEVLPGDNARRYCVEFDLLRCFRYEAHPSMVRLVASCWDQEKVAHVYELDALDTLYNLITEDSFSWSHRIKAALGLANFLEYMHIPAPDQPHLPFLICNLDAAHVMIDRDYNPTVYDYSMISGGSSLIDRRYILNQHVKGCHGYIDPNPAYQGSWSEKSDVFAYGVVLLGLMSKRVYSEHDRLKCSPFVYEWAWAQHNAWKSDSLGFLSSKFSLVHKRLQADPIFECSDGVKLTKLAMQCVDFDPQKRPTMRRVVNSLKKLHIVEYNGELVGIDRLVHLENIYDKRADPYDVYAGDGGGESVDDDDHLSGCQGFLLKKAELTQIVGHAIDRFRAFLPQKIFVPCIDHYFSRWMISAVYQEIPGGQIADGDEELHNAPSSGKHVDVHVYSHADLRLFTSDFCEENLIGMFQFGRVYRGKIAEQEVTVKIWEVPKKYIVYKGDNQRRLWNELSLLQHPDFIAHPNLAKLMGYCYEGEHLGVVYNLKPLDTAKNLIEKDALAWLQIIKILLRVGCLLKFLHHDKPPYLPCLVCNIDVAHIMLDEDYNPVLYDFSMFRGGIIPDRSDERTVYLHGGYGYTDPEYAHSGIWTEAKDVYAFGTVILNLIAKKLYTDEDKLSGTEIPFLDYTLDNPLESKFFGDWARGVYRPRWDCPEGSACSLVHGTLEDGPGFYPEDGANLTDLAMNCIESYSSPRPTMEEAVERLFGLCVVQDHAEALGLKQMLQCSQTSCSGCS